MHEHSFGGDVLDLFSTIFGAAVFVFVFWGIGRLANSRRVSLRLQSRWEVDHFAAEPVPAGGSAPDRAGEVPNRKPKQTDVFETFTARALQVLPYEVFALYPALKTTLSAFPPDFKHSFAAIITLISVYVLRTRILEEELRPQTVPLICSLVICFFWIYSVSGYVYKPGTALGMNQAQTEAAATVLLFLVGLLVPARYLGERLDSNE